MMGLVLGQLYYHTNSDEWRGLKPGTALARSMVCHPKSGVAVLRVTTRGDGWDLRYDGKSFPVYENANFKYAIRRLHRAGFRRLKIVVCRDKTNPRIVVR